MDYTNGNKDPGNFFNMRNIQRSEIPASKSELHELLDLYMESNFKIKGCEPELTKMLQNSLNG